MILLVSSPLGGLTLLLLFGVFFFFYRFHPEYEATDSFPIASSPAARSGALYTDVSFFFFWINTNLPLSAIVEITVKSNERKRKKCGDRKWNWKAALKLLPTTVARFVCQQLYLRGRIDPETRTLGGGDDSQFFLSFLFGRVWQWRTHSHYGTAQNTATSLV